MKMGLTHELGADAEGPQRWVFLGAFRISNYMSEQYMSEAHDYRCWWPTTRFLGSVKSALPKIMEVLMDGITFTRMRTSLPVDSKSTLLIIEDL